MPHQCTTCGYVFEDGSKEMLSGCPECDGTTFQFYPSDTDVSELPSSPSPSSSSSSSSSSSPSPSSLPSPSSASTSGQGRVGKHVGRATSTVREWMSSESSVTNGSREITDSSSDSNPNTDTNSNSNSEESPEADDEYETDETDENEDYADLVTDDHDSSSSDGPENAAQASARSEFVSQDKLPPHSASSASSSASLPAPSSPSPPPGDGRVVREPTGDQPDLDELRQELNDQFESIKIIEPGQYELNLMELYDREEYIIALQENGRYVIQMPESWRGSGDE